MGQLTLDGCIWTVIKRHFVTEAAGSFSRRRTAIAISLAAEVATTTQRLIRLSKKRQVASLMARFRCQRS